MKKKYFISILFIVSITSVFAQESKFRVASGAGYYLDTFGMVGGEIIWLEGGIDTGNEFFLKLRLSMADVRWEISQGLFKGDETMILRQMLDLTFSRIVRINKRHALEPSIGFKLKKEYDYYPKVEFYNNNVYASYLTKLWEIGLTICLDYHYDFKSGAFIGLRCDTNVIYACGFEGLTISPLIGFKF